jgi:uncharacterized membrane protein YesL
VLRVAAEDLYYNGVRLIVANVTWGIGALLTAYVLTRSLLGLLALVVMVPLTVGLMGMATALVRERNVVMSDFLRPIRARFWRLLALGLAQLAVVAIAAFDLVIGLQLGGLAGLVLTVVAFYTVLAIWLLALAVWPIVADPERREEPLRSDLRLGALLVLAHPIRMGLLAIVVGLLAIVSTIFAAAIITFAAVYLALVAAHFVLPAADRLEGRPTLLEGETGSDV